MKALLEVAGLSVWYGKAIALENVSLTVGEGEIVAVLGPNGAGKSTLLKAVSRMQPSQGTLALRGVSLQGFPAHEVVGKGICHCPEGRRLFPELSVLKNLMLGAYLRRDRAEVERDLEFVYALFPILRERAGQIVSTLSGGQQQMVAIGRALMLHPKMLIMDEPSLGLAPLLVTEVMGVIRRVAESGLPILLVEQNVMQVLKISDRTYVLENGKLVLEGPSPELMGNPMIKKAYLGL